MRIGDLVRSHDPGTGGRERIAAFAAVPLIVTELHIARTHIVQNRIAGNVFSRVAFGNAGASLPYDHGELSFVIHFLRVGRQLDGITGAADGVVRLKEENRRGGRLHAALTSMV